MSIDFEHNEMMGHLESDIEKKVEDENVLDMKELLTSRLTDLRKYKNMRIEMAAKRAAIDRAIKILDKRIEMSLDDIKTLQMPI